MLAMCDGCANWIRGPQRVLRCSLVPSGGNEERRMLRACPATGLAIRLAVFGVVMVAHAQVVAQPETAPAHGLRGHYYTAHLRRDFPDYKGVDYDDYWLPTPNKTPDAERVDARIAFGKTSGFALDAGKQREWYAAPMTTAVIWTGYIRFPAAGTYHLVTVSHNASAVYLNDARVSLCGGYGGVAPSADFAIDEPGLDQLANPGTDAYAMPITVDGPRVLPITVLLSMRNASSIWGFGIDLYWTTPDSPRDAQGKPVARIVPSDALYPDAPEKLAPATVSAARSSLTADRLYFFQRMSKPVNLRVRLLDREGKPLAGRRVHLTALADKGNAATIGDPPPTDADGVTLATLSPDPKAQSHVTKIFATAVDDWVDIAQSAEVDVVDATSDAPGFFSDVYSPYYDAHALQIDPGVPVAGKPTRFTVPLQNHLKYPVSLYVVLKTMEFNIGISDWQEIGKSERVTLQPGESHVFQFTWTPSQSASHQCFSAVVMGRVVQGKAQSDTLLPSRAFAHSAFPSERARFVLAAWAPSEPLLAQHFCDRRTTRICFDDPFTLIGSDEDVPLAQTQRNLAVSGVGNWAAQKLSDKYGSVPLAPGVDLDPAKGRVSAGTGVDVNIRGHRIGGVNASGSVGAEASSDPHKILSVTANISGDAFGYHVTVINKTGVVPAPAAGGLFEFNTSQTPTAKALRGAGATN